MFISAILTWMCIVILVSTSDANDAREDPRLPIQGTKNWERLVGPKFTPRHSHATTSFKCPDDPSDSCLWLTGGYSELHRSFNVEIEQNENADVWVSRDGADWTQVELYGDFLNGIGNGDALVGGRVAPWYARYGHTLHRCCTGGCKTPPESGRRRRTIRTRRRRLQPPPHRLPPTTGRRR